jgi:hypothetical protein
VAVFAVGEQDTGDERAERHRQARRLEQQRGADHDQQRGRGECFLHACLRHDAQTGAAGSGAAHDEYERADRQREHAPREIAAGAVPR